MNYITVNNLLTAYSVNGLGSPITDFRSVSVSGNEYECFGYTNIRRNKTYEIQFFLKIRRNNFEHVPCLIMCVTHKNVHGV